MGNAWKIACTAPQEVGFLFDPDIFDKCLTKFILTFSLIYVKLYSNKKKVKRKSKEEYNMPRGGARAGAGRKKSSGDPKTMRGFRITDAEWEYLKSALEKHRDGSDVAAESHVPSKLESGILAHLEALYEEDLKWLTEYENYLTQDGYEKYAVEEIRLHRKIVRIQIVALIPHIKELGFSYDVKRALSSDCSVSLANIEVFPWNIPTSIDYQKSNRNLLNVFQKCDNLVRKIIKLERENDDG